MSLITYSDAAVASEIFSGDGDVMVRGPSDVRRRNDSHHWRPQAKRRCLGRHYPDGRAMQRFFHPSVKKTMCSCCPLPFLLIIVRFELNFLLILDFHRLHVSSNKLSQYISLFLTHTHTHTNILTHTQTNTHTITAK